MFSPQVHFLVVSALFVMYASFVASSFYDQKESKPKPKLNITTCAPDRTSCSTIFEEGDFGEQSPKTSAKGWLLALGENNISGCTDFKVNVISKPWIALVSRGGCRFETKIDNAYKHNATAVIVYNNENEDIRMIHKESQDIVAISIDKSLGEKLAKALFNGTKVVYVSITVDYDPKTYQLNPASVLFVSVSFIVLMVISLAWLVFYYVQRFRYVHARDKTEKRLTSAAKKAIAKLPTHTLSKKDEDDEIDSCAVCLDGYKAGDVTRILPCQHVFHKLCIDPWLVEHRTCPMCKCNILKELGLPCEVQQSQQDVEVGTSELQEQEDHRNAAHNPVVALVDVTSSTTQEQRRLSCDEESSGSSNESGQILCVSAEVNWEREEQSSSTSNLVPSSSVNT